MNKKQLNLSLDVEADGPCSGLYSMLSFGLVRVEDLSDTFYATIRPISDKYDPVAMAVGGFTREEAMQFEPAEAVMGRLKEWVEQRADGQRAVIWSDNPAFDWQFLNYYCHAFLGGNPFGHSARRIGDLYAGWQKSPQKSRDWRKWRGEPHTHNALNDARGNARALARIFDCIRGSVPPRRP